MRRSLLLGFLLLLTFDTLSQVGIKIAGQRIEGAADGAWLLRLAREPLIHLVLLCYLGAFLTYISLLKYAPVGPAYAAAHGHIVTVLLVSMIFLGERLTLLQWLGAASIVAGVLVMARTETAEAAASHAASAQSQQAAEPTS